MVSSRMGLVLSAALLVVACNKSEPLSDPAPGASGTKAAPANTYRAKGIVKGFGEGRKTVKIAHDEIPGYMKAMTMPFGAKSPELLNGLNEGDSVDFAFVEGPGGVLVIQTITKR